MLGQISVGFSLLCLIALPVLAEDFEGSTSEEIEVTRRYLGNGRLLVNDMLGDGKDRWRTASYNVSVMRGYGWNGDLPDTFGDLLEFRFMGELIQPADIVTPAPGDRPYAGAWSFGLHSHYETARGNELSFGGDLVVIGPQTGIDSLQSSIHRLFGMDEPSAATLAGQIGNKLRPSATLEVGRELEFGNAGQLRPFVELRAGVETFARVGFDYTFGSLGQGAMMVRDPVTGQRFRAIKGTSQGLSFVMGADIAKVWDSTYLPEDQGYTLTDSRSRVRAGVNWQGEKWSVFYGATWLGKEFVGQSEGQVTGAININVKF